MTSTATCTADLTALAADFWAWRAAQQPRSPDDIPRIDRPTGWLPDFSAAAVERYRADLTAFEARRTMIAATYGPLEPADEVDLRLLGSALARVRWELDVLRSWQTQPGFYVDQTLGSVFDLLTAPDVDAARLADVTRLLAAAGDILRTGLTNLTGHAVAEFTALAIEALDGVEGQVAQMVDALVRLNPDGWTAPDNQALAQAGERAAGALAAYRTELGRRLPGLEPATPVGREAFGQFLQQVALVPYTPTEVLRIGRREAERAVALEMLERTRNGSGPRSKPAASFTTGAEQSAAQRRCEQQVRDFYRERRILGQPDTLRHYHTSLFPDYLEPIAHLGTADDLTGPRRLDENGGAYFPPPGDGLPYFYAANAHDPRAGIIHEGAHYQQLALSWRHPRQLRRHYYDSTANEGIAFYNEEMLLAAGLFDDAPRTREIVYNFMRLRALRVVVDVQLALGELDIEGAAAVLENSVPMDRETARSEAAFFASTPGQAMTYQVGKTQILALLADAVLAQGDAFDLQAFHDRLWLEGNVPIALQRYELLGDHGELDRIDALAGG
jgi:uncharacterized protein (DUF885 family)